MIKTSRIRAGEYRVWETSNPERHVRVVKVCYPGDGVYWIAAPSFDWNTSDPLDTKAEAVASAKRQLIEN